MDDKLARLYECRARAVRASKALDTVNKDDPEVRKAARTATKIIKKIDLEIEDRQEELTRMGDSAPGASSTRSSANAARAWARRAADAIWTANNFNGETRAITASSIDIPQLVLPQVIPMARPKRIIDLIVDRQETSGNSYEYYRQTTRTNNAAFVADAATKPTSTFTVTPIEDRVRVLAHLSEAIPNRLFQDHAELQSWLVSELYEGLLDALEQQVINGDGTGENITGILHASGTTAVAFETDILTTLRSALTAFENSGVQPNGWVLNPADAAAIDLLRESASPSLFVTAGYSHGPANSANIFGDDIPRLVSPRVPAGTALLADWTKSRLFMRGGIMTQLNPFAGFATNTTLLRSEMRVGFGLIRPSDFAVIDLTSS